MTAELLDVAVHAVADASTLARRVQRSILDDLSLALTPDQGRSHFATLAKSDASPVTIADFAIQALVALRLERALGAGRFQLIGEESAAALREPAQAGTREAVIEAVQGVDPEIATDDVLRAIDLGRAEQSPAARRPACVWTIDPIDGTKGFLRGGQYAVCLAAIEGFEVIASVLGCPNLPATGLPDDTAQPSGVLLVAERGGGCWQRAESRPADRGSRVQRHPIDPDGELVLCESVEIRSMAPVQREALLDAAGIRRRPVRLDSQCKYALVARGDADLYIRIPRKSLPHEFIWDHASGVLCVQEAGGAASDLDGKPLDFGRGQSLDGNRGVVACAQEVWGRLVGGGIRN